jgi:hypothetical protein
MKKVKMLIWGVLIGSMVSSGCQEWTHWDRHGYDKDDGRYDGNDRRGYGDGRPNTGYAR